MSTSHTKANVLLALDGSKKDERALEVGAAFAWVSDANVHVVRVVTSLVAVDLAAGAAAYGIPSAGPILRDSIEQSLRDAADRLTVRAPGRVTSAVIDGDDVAGAVIRAAEEHDVRAIVLATRAPGMLRRAFLGRVADEVVRASSRPVLVVPPKTDDGEQVEFRRALVPVDGAQAAMAVLPLLADLPRARYLELTLLHVAAPHLMHASMRPAQRELGDVADRLRRLFQRVDVHVLESTEPATVIADSLAALKIDLIVMTTRGHSGLSRMFLGSVATGVVQRSDVPVLLVTS